MARAQGTEASEGCIYAAQKQPYLTALGSHSKITMLSIFQSHVHAAGEYGTADLYRVSHVQYPIGIQRVTPPVNAAFSLYIVIMCSLQYVCSANVQSIEIVILYNSSEDLSVAII